MGDEMKNPTTGFMRRHESFHDGSTNAVRKGFLTAQELECLSHYSLDNHLS